MKKDEKIKNKKSKKYTILKTLLILILIAILAFVGYLVYGTIKNGGGAGRFNFYSNGTNTRRN